ncbi:angiopoietin-related protein 7-like isoform X3 [Ostrea edulis]|uniref:angiopoietin-related protein 7-like isoform X3 n=1 Tax=Ostrea edulis TaxID=37623 RepID=UPI0024AF4A00|nr:angiopoietin-related protein 7-like isoform X3 [Ostrea edulis]
MQRVLFAGLLCLIGVVGVLSHLEMNSDNKSELSSLTSSKISNSFRDLLNQESLLRFSMTQKIQGLVMDALDNRNNSLTLKKKLSDITTELQSIGAKDQVMKEENAQLKQELNTVKEAINHDKNLTKQEFNTVKEAINSDKNLIMQQIQSLAEKMEDENSKLRQEIKILNETNQRVDEENFKLRHELNNLKMMSLDNKQNVQNINNMTKTIHKHNDEFTLQFQMINGSLQNHDLQLQNISTQLSSVRLKLIHGSCMRILQSDPGVKRKDGVYSIKVNDQVKEVYCDMTTDGGGWTVIQKRQDNSTDFYKTWADYKKGFGDPSTNYWLGNDAIHFLTMTNQELRVELMRFSGEKAYALYSTFKIGDENSKYQLTVSGYSGTAGNSLKYHSGHQFSTWDQDNDATDTNCAVQYHGAWWYLGCHFANLNGRYAESALSHPQYPVWYHWESKYVALKNTAMMIRPKI